jgi:hypothetical protein
MYTIINFISFVILTTFAIRSADPIALVISIVGFTIMHVMCEDMDIYTEQSKYNNYKLGEK